MTTLLLIAAGAKVHVDPAWGFLVGITSIAAVIIGLWILDTILSDVFRALLNWIMGCEDWDTIPDREDLTGRFKDDGWFDREGEFHPYYDSLERYVEPNPKAVVKPAVLDTKLWKSLRDS